MAHLCLVRVDSRMIHGQVMTMWSKFDGVNHILAIDDGIAADPFMQEIYKMAVPHTLKVSMISVKEAAERFQNGTLDDDRYLVLFKECNTPLRAWKEGFKFEELQIGNLTPTKKTKILHSRTRLSEEHMPDLYELADLGVTVYAQAVPTDRKIPLSEIK
jgi:mannose/fructose/N-acetylgalactosamine-specific phosphotransferase system component IIB